MKVHRKIHINQHHIKKNQKYKTNLPVITVKTNSKTNEYGHEVEIKGPCKVIYRPNDPLSCGARVWIETESDVRIYQNDTKERTEEVKADLLDAFKDI